MMELEYIPLKTAEGAVCGHAKVRSGTVELSLRAGRSGEAVVLTDGGSFTGSPGARIPTAGRVQAVALREGGVLRCCGVARRSAYTLAEVRLRLSASGPLWTKPEMRVKQAVAPAEEREQAPRESPPRTRQADAPVSAPAAPAAAQEERPVPKTAPREKPEPQTAPMETLLPEDGQPFHPDTAIKQALSRLAEETTAAFLEDLHPEPMLPERILPAPAKTLPEETKRESPATLEDTAADTEAFSALMARADAVFQKISAPVSAGDWNAPLDREEIWKDSAAANSVPAGSDPVRRDPVRQDAADWCSAVDRLLGAEASPAGRIPVQNPFPHIFPGARFFRESDGEPGTLQGEWISGRERMSITAVRGDYSPQPPERLPGFTRYIRAKSGGYWVKVNEAP